jgi:kynurenine formamidase
MAAEHTWQLGEGLERRSRWRSAALVAALALLLAACAAPAPTPAPARGATRTVDLSHVVREDMPRPASEPRLERDPDGKLRQLAIGASSGSLVRVAVAPDAAPIDVETLSPRDLVLPAVVIDARDRAQDAPGFSLSVEEVLAWERTHGPVPPGALVLLATGWDMRWGDAAAYQGGERSPGFSPAAADLLLNQRGAAALGLDAPGASFTPASGFRLLLENLTSVEQLPPTGATVVIGALKLQRAQSSPARVLALIP